MMLVQTISQAESNVQVALITAIFALAGIVITSIFARMSSHPKTPKEDPDAKKTTTDSLLASYSGEQNEFMHLVIQDSKDVHRRMDKFESIVDQMKLERTQLVGAFSRYILKLVQSWGSGGKIPYPDDEDFKILEETLPVDWRRRSK